MDPILDDNAAASGTAQHGTPVAPAAKPPQVVELKVAAIRVPRLTYSLIPALPEGLSDSFRHSASAWKCLLTIIVIEEGGGYRLLAGYDRLEAARQLELDSVMGFVAQPGSSEKKGAKYLDTFYTPLLFANTKLDRSRLVKALRSDGAPPMVGRMTPAALAKWFGVAIRTLHRLLGKAGR